MRTIEELDTDEIEAMRRIRTVLYSGMPAVNGADTSPHTLADVATSLEALAPYVMTCLHEADETRRELDQLKRDVAAMRRLLGSDREETDR